MHTHHFSGLCPGKPGFAGYPFDSKSLNIPILSILVGLTKTLQRPTLLSEEYRWGCPQGTPVGLLLHPLNIIGHDYIPKSF